MSSVECPSFSLDDDALSIVSCDSFQLDMDAFLSEYEQLVEACKIAELEDQTDLKTKSNALPSDAISNS